MSEPSKIEEKERKKEEREGHRPRERERRRKKKEGAERRAMPCSASGSVKKLKKVCKESFQNFIGPESTIPPKIVPPE